MDKFVVAGFFLNYPLILFSTDMKIISHGCELVYKAGSNKFDFDALNSNSLWFDFHTYKFN